MEFRISWFQISVIDVRSLSRAGRTLIDSSGSLADLEDEDEDEISAGSMICLAEICGEIILRMSTLYAFPPFWPTLNEDRSICP